MSWENGDFTGDTYVGIDDLAILGNNYGRGTGGGEPVPEPGVLAMLVIGGVALIRRRW